MILRVEHNKSIAFKMSPVQLMNKRLYNELMACKQAARLLQHLRVCRQAISELVNCRLFMAFVVQKDKKDLAELGFLFSGIFFGPLSPFSINSPTLKINLFQHTFWAHYREGGNTVGLHLPVHHIDQWFSTGGVSGPTCVFLIMASRLKFMGQWHCIQ